jgi:DNA-binding CsgD family transcriptional regulator
MNNESTPAIIQRSHHFIFDTPFKYFGFTLLLVWHYCLWFVPNIFPSTPLLNDAVTISWLVDLLASALTVFLIPIFLGKKRHLSRYRFLYWAAPAVTFLGTLYLTTYPTSFDTILVAAAISACLGMASAVLWILWGERYGRIRANFSIKHIAPMFSGTLLVSLLLVTVVPPPVCGIFTGLLPLVSGSILIFTNKATKDRPFPLLLPTSTSRRGMQAIFVVCLISFVTSMACYYLVAIIEWERLMFTAQTFTFGIVGGGVIMMIITVFGLRSKDRHSIFKLFPWLLVLTAYSFILFLLDERFHLESFIVALAVSSVLEVLLTMYFGILTSRGYAAPALAFGLCAGFVRLGIALGNTLAILYEKNPSFGMVLIAPTAFLFVAILIALLIPLVHQEYSIVALTKGPSKASDLDKICGEIAKGFSLSEREAETLCLMARGYSSSTIAERLVISPYTVNTHIQHIYEKMQLHKRSELLNYIDMHPVGE